MDGDECASSFTERPDTIFKIHGDAHWQVHLELERRVEKFVGTRYAVYLDEAYVPRGGDAWEKLRDAPHVSRRRRSTTRTSPTRVRRSRRALYPRDVPGCVTAGKDHHCRMKTYGNRTVPLFTSSPTSSPVVAPHSRAAPPRRSRGSGAGSAGSGGERVGVGTRSHRRRAVTLLRAGETPPSPRPATPPSTPTSGAGPRAARHGGAAMSGVTATARG